MPVTRGFFKESRNTSIYYFNSSDQISLGNGSNATIIYEKKHDLTGINTLLYYCSADKGTDNSSDNTINLTVGGVVKAVTNLPDTTQVDDFEIIDVSGNTGMTTIKVHTGGGTDPLLLSLLHLQLVE